MRVIMKFRRYLASSFSVQSAVATCILVISGMATFVLLESFVRVPVSIWMAQLDYGNRADEGLCLPPVTAHDSQLALPDEWPDKSEDDLWREDASWAGQFDSGGTFRPKGCRPSTVVAILIPFRNRSSHLAHFLNIMHPFLIRQNIQYTIVVINQTDNAPFMRGLLFNAGYLELKETLKSRVADIPDCVVLHDVDHLPERHGMFYTCSPHGPMHLSHAIDRFDYNLFMQEFTGGVSGLNRHQFEAVNGYSNLYMGWGCEDEDFFVRLSKQKQLLIRVPPQLARYKTMPHVPNYPNWFWDQMISGLDRKRYPNLRDIVDKDGTNSERYDFNKYLQACAHKRTDLDGLNNARSFYNVDDVILHNSFTEIKISTRSEAIYEEGVRYIMDFVNSPEFQDYENDQAN